MRRIVTAPKLAIRVDENTLLAVPPLPPNTPREVRVKVFEYVLRRQPGLAQMTAEIALAADENKRKALGLIPEGLLSELPNGQLFGRSAA